MNTLFDLPPKQPPPPPREDTGAEEKRDFRRNLIGVGIGHALILLVLFCAGIFQKEPKREEILWLNEGAMGGGESAAAAAEPETEPEIPIPDPPVQKIEEPLIKPPPVIEEKPVPSDIVEPKTKPPPATPKPATPKPATPKTKAAADASPKPKAEASPKPKADAAKKAAGTPGVAKKEGDKSATAKTGTGTKPGATSGGTGDGTGKGKTGTGKDAMSTYGWYTDMLHDRYYSRWEQPVGIGQDVIATVKLRILKDGTIEKHDLVKSSGNPQMDESVMSAVEKVQQIDPLPAGLGNGEYFDLNVAFKVGG